MNFSLLNFHNATVLSIALSLLVLTGCTSPRLEHSMRDRPIGTAYKPSNVYAVIELPTEFDRVLLLPPSDPTGGELSSELVDALIAALRRTARFEVIPSGQAFAAISDPGIQLPLLAGQAIPPAILAEAQRLQAKGIMQLQFTHYRPYKPLQIGLRGRLLELKGQGRVLWEIDELFDAGQKSVAIGARRYADAHIEQPFPLQSSYSVLMSPVRFAGYVGTVSFGTLPLRPLL
jgi:hypothetical protein